MPACAIFGGCSWPGLPGGRTCCKHCRAPVHKLCFQRQNAIGDKPDGGMFCGPNGGCNQDVPRAPAPAGGPRDASSQYDVPEECAAGTECQWKNAQFPVLSTNTCCDSKWHMFCLRQPCQRCGAPGSPGKICIQLFGQGVMHHTDRQMRCNLNEMFLP